MSDSELMATAISNHDLKKMLQNTAARPSLPSTHGAIGGLGALLIKSGRPGQVPSVAAATKRMIDVIRAVSLAPDPGVVSEGIARNTDGSVVFPGWSKNGCSGNQAPNGTWASHRTHTWSAACGVGHTSVAGGVSSGVTTLAGAVAFIDSPTRAVNATLWQLNNQNGLAGGKRSRHRYWRSSDIGAVLRQVPGLTEPGQPTPTPGKGGESPEGTAGSLPGVGRHFATANRPRTRLKLRDYESPAVRFEVVPGARGQPPVLSPPTKAVHRQQPSKERKTLGKLGFALLKGYHTLTEINDLFDSLADAIPGKPCSKLPGFAKMWCVLTRWDEIDPVQAAKNVLWNEIEDRVVARLQGQLRDALESAGGPNVTQVQQFLRTLRQLQ